MLSSIFFISLVGFLALYILRGIGWITFLPGGVFIVLLMAAMLSGLTWGIVKTRRY